MRELRKVEVTLGTVVVAFFYLKGWCTCACDLDWSFSSSSISNIKCTRCFLEYLFCLTIGSFFCVFYFRLAWPSRAVRYPSFVVRSVLRHEWLVLELKSRNCVDSAEN